jgi:hypothetical protein
MSGNKPQYFREKERGAMRHGNRSMKILEIFLMLVALLVARPAGAADMDQYCRQTS